MIIHGISQTTGEERTMEVGRHDANVLLHIRGGTDDGTDRGKVALSAADIVAALTDPPPGPVALTGTSPLYGTRKHLDMEVRRNEVLLTVRSGEDGGRDIAVGLDDLQDAIEAVA